MRPKLPKEIAMRKFLLSLAGIAALGLVVPYAAPAKAEKIVIHHHGDRDYHHHHHKVVIIKHSHHHDHD
jgi:hypothetical protein